MCCALLCVYVCRQQLSAEAAKSEAAAATAAEAAAVWQEVLLQTEEDLEQQAERDGERLAAARHEAGEVSKGQCQPPWGVVHTLCWCNVPVKSDFGKAGYRE